MSLRYDEAERQLGLPPRNAWGRRNENPPGVSFWKLIREDLRTHDGNPFEQGFWAVAVHRFGNWRMDLPKILRAPCTLIYLVMEKMVQVFAGITLPSSVKLGRRVRIWHHSGIVVVARYIGNDVHIRQNVTMGVAKTWTTDCPIIEDGVHIGVGATILGRVIVGREARVGANSLVLYDVDDQTTVVGVPATAWHPRDRMPQSSERTAETGTNGVVDGNLK